MFYVSTKNIPSLPYHSVSLKSFILFILAPLALGMVSKPLTHNAASGLCALPHLNCMASNDSQSQYQHTHTHLFIQPVSHIEVLLSSQPPPSESGIKLEGWRLGGRVWILGNPSSTVEGMGCIQYMPSWHLDPPKLMNMTYNLVGYSPMIPMYTKDGKDDNNPLPDYISAVSPVRRRRWASPASFLLFGILLFLVTKFAFWLERINLEE